MCFMNLTSISNFGRASAPSYRPKYSGHTNIVPYRAKKVNSFFTQKYKKNIYNMQKTQGAKKGALRLCRRLLWPVFLPVCQVKHQTPLLNRKRPNNGRSYAKNIVTSSMQCGKTQTRGNCAHRNEDGSCSPFPKSSLASLPHHAIASPRSFPSTTAVAFGHHGKILLKVFASIGAKQIGYNGHSAQMQH